jgi:hypothetical protein
MKLIALIDSECNHYGSTMVGPVASTLNISPPDFVEIEGVSIVTTNNTVDTPSHQYAVDGEENPLFHTHPNQLIDDLGQNFITIENEIILLKDDSSSAEDTRIDSAGSNEFVFVEI